MRKLLQREGEKFQMDAEVACLEESETVAGAAAFASQLPPICPQVLVVFSDFEIMERVCALLLEKLDRSVGVGTPYFYHSPECLTQMR